ncbi:MAG: aminotransferase class I/II-fold pyridoxal phosphate-dependent enzyme [Synergistaceae bacterium]|nr:aminotransferase class I/II-fold pyridoxal phosphate-dependent enzyme [Synergistaceae bacterium]
MKRYESMTREELQSEFSSLASIINDYKDKKYNLVMARGKPSEEQLAISLPMLDVLTSKSNLYSEDGVDCKNYGEIAGIIDAKKLFSEYMEVEIEEIFIAGSSSLELMSNILASSMLRGVLNSDQAWIKYPKIKFICPVPGYDRHFKMCEYFGIEMLNVPLDHHGPNMDMIERMVKNDDTIKGIWCVPKYSNPTGTSYADETVRRLANMETAAHDFRIFWDNAYAVHSIYRHVNILNLLAECKKSGNPNRAYMFGSTSKITLPGAGVCFFAASKENITFMANELGTQCAGWDKLNMLRHVRFLKNIANIKDIMDKHAEIIRPRFDIVIKALKEELLPRGAGEYIHPDGGYFITFKGKSGCARKIVELCKLMGVIVTSAGATHPHGKDPDDSYIRLAPTSISLTDLEKAIEIFCIAARFVTLEKYLYHYI